MNANKTIHEARGLTEDKVLKAIYESGLHQYAPTVLKVSWKDGIDINRPSAALMNFVRKLSNNQ